MKKYSARTEEFARRARDLFARGTCEGLLYSALELRLGIEARTQTYIQANDQISNELKKGYHAGKLTRALKATHSDGQYVATIDILLVKEQLPVCSYHFIPISKRLGEIYGLLGGYLHYKGMGPSFTEPWWDSLKLLLESGIADLEICSRGSLLGVPLWQKSTGEVNIKMEVSKEDPRIEIVRRLAETKAQHIFRVEYQETESYYASAR